MSTVQFSRCGGYSTTKRFGRQIILCLSCEKMYKGDFEPLTLEHDLFSDDTWAQDSTCAQCQLTLYTANARNTKKQ